MQLALFIAAIAWVFAAQQVAASSSRGLAFRFSLVSGQPLLSAILFLFLLVVGFSVLQAISNRATPLRELIGLPQRSTSAQEWAVGAAIGWGAMLFAVLPMALAGTLHVHLWAAPRAFYLVLINLLTLAAAALAEEVAFRGFAYRRLIQAVGPVTATLFMSVLFGLVHMLNPSANWTSVLITMLAGLLLSLGWLRTHGLWLPWGLHFAWNASMGILFGLPISGLDRFSTVVQTRAIGPAWLTGGFYGPEAATLTAVVLLAAIFVLVRATRDYAWNYTHPPIVAAGYPMDVAPPPAHAAMEAQAAAAPPPLVQILSTTPQTRSVAPPPPPMPPPPPPIPEESND
jgi:membrane protease YdiL (CAAX protease family)